MRLALILALLPLPALAEAFDIVSRVDGLTVGRVSQVPANPEPVSTCEDRFPPAASALAKLISTKGWTVTAEVTFQGLTLISFAGQAEGGTSGTCALSNGNLAVAKGDRLLGILYADPTIKRGIGSVWTSHQGVWLLDGSLEALPLAAVTLAAPDVLMVQPLPQRESFCDGTTSVPLTYGLSLWIARRIFLAEGWTPAPEPTENAPEFTAEMQRSLPEVWNCSGTGQNHCDSTYGRADGATLRVATIGELAEPDYPMVTGYDITCQPKP